MPLNPSLLFSKTAVLWSWFSPCHNKVMERCLMQTIIIFTKCCNKLKKKNLFCRWQSVPIWKEWKSNLALREKLFPLMTCRYVDTWQLWAEEQGRAVCGPSVPCSGLQQMLLWADHSTAAVCPSCRSWMTMGLLCLQEKRAPSLSECSPHDPSVCSPSTWWARLAVPVSAERLGREPGQGSARSRIACRILRESHWVTWGLWTWSVCGGAEVQDVLKKTVESGKPKDILPCNCTIILSNLSGTYPCFQSSFEPP